jgi:hypothetical protein
MRQVVLPAPIKQIIYAASQAYARRSITGGVGHEPLLRALAEAAPPPVGAGQPVTLIGIAPLEEHTPKVASTRTAGT